MTVCDKLDTPDDCGHTRESIENPEPATIEWEIEFNPPADRVEIVVDEINGVDRITAEYDKMGMLHITKVYAEERTVNDITHEKGETHQTLSFPKENYRVSQDFDSNGVPITGTAHITDQNTQTVVWRESDPHK